MNGDTLAKLTTKHTTITLVSPAHATVSVNVEDCFIAMM